MYIVYKCRVRHVRQTTSFHFVPGATKHTPPNLTVCIKTKGSDYRQQLIHFAAVLLLPAR